MTCPSQEVFRRFLEGGLDEGDDVASLERHLDTCSACGPAFLELARTTHAFTGQSAAGGLLARGSSVGRLTVLEVLGRGANGTVYVAFDPQLDRRVALKVLDAWAASESTRLELVLREARAGARLAHPNIVPVHDAGLLGGVPFVVMELVDGVPLSKWLEAPRSLHEVLRLFFDVAHALAYAHEAGIAHGDVRSANVLVGTDGRVRLTDFGLSATAHATVAEDVKAAAALLDGALEQKGTHLQTPWLRHVLERAAQGQFASMAAMLEALEAPRRRVRVWTRVALVGLGLLVVAGVVGYRRLSCRPPVDALAGVWDDRSKETLSRAFGSLEGPFAASTLELVRGALDRWRASWLEASVQSCRSSAALDDLARQRRAACLDEARAQTAAVVKALSQVDASMLVRAHAATSALESPDRCLDDASLARDALPLEPTARAAVLALRSRLMEARTLRDLGQLRQASTALETLADLSRDGGVSLYASVAFERGATLGRLGDHEAAVASLDEAIESGLASRNDEAAARAAVLLVYEYGVALHRQPESSRSLVLARALVRRLSEPTLEGGLLVNEALVEETFGTLEGALARQRSAVARCEDAGIVTPALANALQNESRLLVLLGRPDEAEQGLTKALAILEKARGPYHPNVGAALDVLGVIALEREQFPKAVELFERSIEIHRGSAGEKSLPVFLGLAGLSEAQRGVGDLTTAEASARKGLEGLEALTSATDERLLDPLLALAELQRARGDVSSLEATLARMAGCKPSKDPQVRARRVLLEAELAETPEKRRALATSGLADARAGSRVRRRLEALAAP